MNGPFLSKFIDIWLYVNILSQIFWLICAIILFIKCMVFLFLREYHC